MEIKVNIDGKPEFPDIIYKYRKWNDEYQKTILTERTVFLAPPTSFEDKKDCKLLKRYDLMRSKDIYNKYLEYSKRDNPLRTRQQHQAHAREEAKQSLMRNPKYVKHIQEEHFREFDKRFGVLSLTANPMNIKMWEKYSDDGKGFCVGFYPEIMFPHLGGGGKVLYYDKLPNILHDDDFHTEHFKQVFSKEDIWTFEEEYRTHRFYENPPSQFERCVILPSNAYKEIIFGWQTPPEFIEEIKSTCSIQNLNVVFIAPTIAKKLKENLENQLVLLCVSLEFIVY